MQISQLIERSERDACLDSLRGICVLGVIFIHTTFWSGSSYVPSWMQSLSLLLDVPAFFFVSGMSASITRKIDLPQTAFRIATTFALLAMVYELLTGQFQFTATISALTLSSPDLKLIPVVSGSFWFVPVFLVVLLFAAPIIRRFGFVSLSTLCIMLMSYIVLSYFIDIWQPPPILNTVNASFLSFYLFAFLFGFTYRSIIKSSDINRVIIILTALTSAVALFLICIIKDGHLAIILQQSKFPEVRLPYASASLLSFVMLMCVYGKFEKIYGLDHIGRYAIFYYVGQGVGASALLYVTSLETVPWFVRLLIFFILNVIITIITSELIRLLYDKLASLIKLGQDCRALKIVF